MVLYGGGGGNLYGELGVGSTLSSFHDFIQIGSANNWKNIAPSDSFTIAQKNDNSIWGWGQNDDFQMGNGTCCSDQLTPTLISSATDWKMIAASGSRSAFAIKQNGTLWAWGSELSGLVGNDGSVHFPIQRHPDTDWDFISAGKSHVLAIKTNRTLWSWGNNNWGETGTQVSTQSIITQVDNSTWKTVAAGYQFSIGIKTDGTLWAWGWNNYGQLGLGNTTNMPFPTQIGTDNDWDKISAGRNHTVAQKTNGSIWVWGDNFYGQLGDGSSTDGSTTPLYLAIDGCTLANESFSKETTNLVVTPNPLQNELTVNYKGDVTINTIVIYDILGKIVYQSNPVATTSLMATFPITELQSGTYTLVLKNNDTTVVSKKLVKD